MKLKNSGERKI